MSPEQALGRTLSTIARTSSRWARSSTRWRPGGARSRVLRHRDVDGGYPRGARADRAAESDRSRRPCVGPSSDVWSRRRRGRYASTEDLARDLKERARPPDGDLFIGRSRKRPSRQSRAGAAGSSRPSRRSSPASLRASCSAAFTHAGSDVRLQLQRLDLGARSDPNRPLRPRRPDDRVWRVLGRAPPRDFHDAARQLRIAFPGPRPRRRPLGLIEQRARDLPRSSRTRSATRPSGLSRGCPWPAERPARSSRPWKTPAGRRTGRASRWRVRPGTAAGSSSPSEP